jgi:cell division protein FtsQ
MSQTIKRKAKTARQSAAAKGTRRKVNKAKSQGGSLLGAVLGTLGIGEKTLHRLFLGTIALLALAGIWITASLSGATALAGEQLARIAADTGFEVRRIEVRGVDRIDRDRIYAAALGQKDRSMLQVDIDSLRTDILALSWVKDARVSRQLPDTLVIDIVERTPHAVLRTGDGFVLIDETGHELQVVGPAEARRRLVIAGEGAEEQVDRLSRLLETAPALRPQVREAEWIGHRRWNLTFRTGQILALPEDEGAGEPADAFVRFARLDGTNRLLGGKALAFDMRAADRIYFRVPEGNEDEAASISQASSPSPPVATASVARADTPAGAPTTQETE